MNTFYKDRSYPQGELEIADRGDYVRIEYSVDGYNIDAIYVPKAKLREVLK